jgi:hypothetical protein
MPVPPIGSAVAWGLGLAIPFLVGKVLLAMGITITAYVGFGLVVAAIENEVWGAVNSLPADAYAIFRYAGGVIALQIWFSALAVVGVFKAGKGLFKWNVLGISS